MHRAPIASRYNPNFRDYSTRRALRRPLSPYGAAPLPGLQLPSPPAAPGALPASGPVAMAAAEAALGRWARQEMELPPHIALDAALARRLCSGPGGPIWDFITRHVRHPRNVKKIRGNLLWYRRLEEAKGAEPSAANQALGEAVSRLQQEVGGALGRALAETQAAALELQEQLEAAQARRGAGLRRALELRLMAAAAAREGRSLQQGRGLLALPKGQWEQDLPLRVTMGTEPEVLVSVRALCAARADALAAQLEPRPPLEAKKLTDDDARGWRHEAEAVLSHHPPRLVLWALEQLALDSSLWPRPPEEPRPTNGVAPSSANESAGLGPAHPAQAPPTVQRLIQELWVAVGGVWGLLPPLAARLRPQTQRLTRLRQRLHQRLGGNPRAGGAARLLLEAAALRGAQRGLSRRLQELRGGLGTPQNPPLGQQRLQLQRGRTRLLWRSRSLSNLAGATRSLRMRLRRLRGQAQGAGLAALGGAAAALAQEGPRLQRALGALGALGAPPPRPHPSPLQPISRILGVAPQQPQQGALRRAAALRSELRLAAVTRPPPPPLAGASAWAPPTPWEGANQQLLSDLRSVSAQCRGRLESWPRLLQLVSQWWEQPAQWALAPPPGDTPFSHWLQRWTRAVQALPLAPPRPLLPLAPPLPEGRGQQEPRPLEEPL